MDLDPQRFQQTVDEMTRGVGEARARIAAVPVAADAALALLPIAHPVREVIVWCAERTVEVATELLDLIEQALEGVTAPIWFIEYMQRWQDVRATADGVTADLTPALMPAANAWTGSAATAYRAAAVPQRDAATRIAAIADRTQAALIWSAGTAIGFYVFLGIILVKLIVALATAIAAFGSAVFSPAGVALVIEEAAVDTGLVLTAVSLLAAAIGTQVVHFGALYGDTVDPTAFPAGHWPNPVTGSYSDATVTDGDADWSLRPR